ncbi:hypothetical protein ABK040_009427 [Willaertia magna]
MLKKLFGGKKDKNDKISVTEEEPKQEEKKPKKKTSVQPNVEQVSAKIDGVSINTQPKKETEILESQSGESELNIRASDVERAERTQGDEALKAMSGLSDGLEEMDDLSKKKKKKIGKQKKSLILGDLAKFAAKSGYLSKRGGSIKTWHKRYCIIVGHKLYYYKDENPKNEPLGSVRCSGPEAVQTVDDSGRPNCFKIVSNERTLFCQASSDQDMKDWMNFLKVHTAKLNLKKVKLNSTLQGYLTLLDNNTKEKKKVVYCLLMNGKLYFLNSFNDELPERVIDLSETSVRKIEKNENASDDCGENIIISINEKLKTTKASPTQTAQSTSTTNNNTNTSVNTNNLTSNNNSSEVSGSKGFLSKGNFFKNLVASVENLNQTLLASNEFSDVEVWYEIIRHEAEIAATSEFVRNSSMRGWIKVLQNNDEVCRCVLQEKKRPDNLIWVDRFACLVKGSLYYFVNETDRKPEGTINLAAGRLVTSAVRELACPFAFKISSLSNNFYICVNSDDEAQCWIEEMKEVSRSQDAEYSKAGWLTKQGGSYKSWKERFCVLKGTYLYYFKNPSEPEPQGKVNLKGQMIRHLSPQEAYDEVQKSNVIKIFTAQRTWYFFADTMQDAVEWSIVLKKAALLFRGRTWIVDERLDNFEMNKTSQKCRSISQAIAHAQDTDRIVVYSGVYTESVVVNKALIIEGVGNVVIRKEGTSPLIVDAYSAVKISNIEIVQENAPKELRGDKNAVEVKKGNVMFEHCQIRSKDGNGVVVTEEGGVTMFSCKVSNCNHYGIWLNGKASAIIDNSEICSNEWDGIMLMGNTDCIIRQSEIHKNSYNGVAVSSKGRLNVENCKITENLWDGVSINTDKGVARLFDNIIFDNKGFGIYYARSGVGGINVDNECYNNKKGQVFTLSDKID